jgi:hypothetical protein
VISAKRTRRSWRVSPWTASFRPPEGVMLLTVSPSSSVRRTSRFRGRWLRSSVHDEDPPEVLEHGEARVRGAPFPPAPRLPEKHPRRATDGGGREARGTLGVLDDDTRGKPELRTLMPSHGEPVALGCLKERRGGGGPSKAGVEEQCIGV